MPSDLAVPPGGKAAPLEGPRALSGADLGVVAGLPFLTAGGWLLPEDSWHRFGRALAPLSVPFIGRGESSLLERIRRVGGAQLGQPPEQVLKDMVAAFVERLMPYFRDYRPGGWHPRIEIRGREQIDMALAQGRGVLIWDSYFAHGSLVTKLGLYRDGLAVSHLSHPRHGFSPTRFGMRYLNPVLTRIERRYLGERVVLGLEESKAAMARLRARLEAGGVVSVKVGATAKRPLRPAFLEGRLPLGPGAPLLAYQTGAALLPVHTLRQPDGSYRITVEEELPVPRDSGASAALEIAAQAYAARLEPWVRRHPGDWLGWTEV